jgi:hypothetical protein
MLNPNQIEESYKAFMADLPHCVHDGVFSVDLNFLHEIGLLETFQSSQEDADDLTQYFHVIENTEKVTLFNEQFIVWIIPKVDTENPITLVLIALNHNDKPQLEIVFTTCGVYNTPRYVLRVLQYFFLDMLETEATLTAFEKNE